MLSFAPKTWPVEVLILIITCFFLILIWFWFPITKFLKADCTLRSSQAVPHPSTNRALRRLTSEVGRDLVYSTRYGRQREVMHATMCSRPNRQTYKEMNGQYEDRQEQRARGLELQTKRLAFPQQPNLYLEPKWLRWQTLPKLRSRRFGGETCKKMVTLLDLCVSSLRRGHANLLCIVPILTDDPRRESISQQPAAQHNNCEKHPPICTTKSIAPLAGQSTQRGNRNKKPKPPNFICDRTNQQDSGQISVDRSTTVYSQHLQSLSPTKSSANGYSTPKPG